MYIDSINKMDKNYPLSSFGNVLICSNDIKANKTVTFPDGYELDSNLSFKILFKNGHNCTNDSTHMTLSNGTKAYPIVVNKYGTLIPLPIHKMTESSTTVYKSLQPNTILEMYFDSTYGTDGAFVVIGNPIVLSSDDYTIYADGHINKVAVYGWGKPIKNWLNNHFSSDTALIADTDGFFTYSMYTSQGGTMSLYEDGVLILTHSHSDTSTISLSAPIRKGHSYWTNDLTIGRNMYFYPFITNNKL